MYAKTFVTTALLTASAVNAQSFLEVVKAEPETSLFSSILSNLNSTVTDFFKTLSRNNGGTILVPNNKAVETFLQKMEIKSPADIPLDKVLPFLSYHVLVDNINSAQFSKPGGAIAETKLQGDEYALLTDGGQVVYGTRAEGKGKEEEKGGIEIKSGEGNNVKIVKEDVVFDQGTIHVVDGFLTLPTNCSVTVADQGAEKLVAEIKRLGLLNTLDSFPGATCFAPSDAAIERNLPTLMNLTDPELIDVIKFHTLLKPYYTPDLVDGQKLATSLEGTSITVNIVDGEYYFNGVRAKTTNDIARNGVAYVLDSIMSPTFNGTIVPVSSSTSSAASTSTAAPTGVTTRVGGGNTTVTTGTVSTTTSAPTASGTPSAATRVNGSSILIGLVAFCWVYLSAALVLNSI